MKYKIKDLLLNYEIVGHGKPVIMLHGYAADHRLMMGCMEPIFKNRENYKRIYIDLPGMGESNSGEWINNVDIILDIIIKFIKNIIPNEKFIIAGESYGGYVSRGIIYKMADMIDGILLICPVIIPNMKDRNLPERVVLIKDDDLLAKLSPNDAKGFGQMLTIQNKRTYRRYEVEVASGVKAADHDFLKKLKRNGFKFTFDVDKINAKFDKPALILLGHQDSRVGYKDAWCIIDNYPRATFSILDGAGHNLQIEQEKLFNCLVNEWLDRIEKFKQRKL
ncbi:alpha/beta hydrolase [Clostridium tyrobutyricum]|uniref:alpha/beta fold hydrolase n=1 Tax=Clostridium tyrobutyricum TaxID=1519 RepID=UPI001C38FA96|nr:alpha/beta hydrolase [Clostridium tyrobutyricum]MBV4447940.1 alpha/beta hydrolase [Clostridium tyrobutyricum]